MTANTCSRVAGLAEASWKAATAALKSTMRSRAVTSPRTAPASWARRRSAARASCTASCSGPGTAMASGRSRLAWASWPIRARKPKNASSGLAVSARAWASAIRSSTRPAAIASNNASLVGKCRYTVPGPTPARAAISSKGTANPDAAKASLAARSTFSRLRRASARSGLSPGSGSPAMVTKHGCQTWLPDMAPDMVAGPGC
jgi:hypothetical protein